MFGSHIREVVNGAIVPLSGILAGIIAVHLYRLFKEFGYWETKKHDGSWTACILFWIFMSEAFRSFGAWAVLRTGNMGRDTSGIVWWTTMDYILAGSILVVTFLRCTYFFTPPSWGNRVWITSAAVTLLFLLGSAALKQFGI
jgi:hypothetical protein